MEQGRGNRVWLEQGTGGIGWNSVEQGTGGIGYGWNRVQTDKQKTLGSGGGGVKPLNPLDPPLLLSPPSNMMNKTSKEG